MQDPLELLQHSLGQGDDDTFSWLEAHGFITAAVCHALDTPDLSAISETLSDEQRDALDRLYQRIARQLGADEPFELPCLLDPFQENEGLDLVSWCAGFVSALITHEVDVAPEQADEAAELTLPMLVISGMYEDEELEQLWENDKIILQMAHSIPSVVVSLFLLINAPDTPSPDKSQNKPD